MRLSSVLLVYFVVGATLWGGGVTDYENAGVVDMVIVSVDSGEIQTNPSTADKLRDRSGPIEQAVNTIAGGALLSILGFISGLINYLFWPVSLFISVDAPPRVTALLAGTMTFSFVLGFLAVLRRGF